MSASTNPIGNVTEYIDYFRQMAVSHKDLLHDPSSETGDGPAGSMHFMKISEQEVLSALNTAVGSPFMTIELYQTDGGGESQNPKLKPSGAFMIMDTPADGSFPAQEACYEKTERIMFDILKKIWQDHFAPGIDECQAPFKDFDFSKLSITPEGPAFSNQYGYRVIFEFELQNTIDLTEPPAAGAFL